MYGNLAVIAVFVFLYSIASGRLERTSFGGAVLFTFFGLVAGPLCLGILDMDVHSELLQSLAELTLALVLFTDASNADLTILKSNIQIPRRLLLIGLPLTIVLGFGAGVILFDNLSLFEVAIMATLLAPTDAALGKAVVTDQNVPGKIREGLNVESGLNDGICVPILFVFLALATSAAEINYPGLMSIRLVLEEIGIGVGVGVVSTWLGSRLLRSFVTQGWVTETWMQLPVVAMAISCFALAQVLGGSGFIASFSGGLLFGWLAKNHKHNFLLAAEGTGDTMALITWVLFGAVVIGQNLGKFSPQIFIYAVLSLTVIRMLPVFLVLSGLKLRASEKLFIGWFGSRGLASIVFGVIVLQTNLPGSSTIVLVAECTIILSIIAHGISAHPLINALNLRLKRELIS